MGQKHYTEEQVAHAMAVLRSNGGNLKQTSKATGVMRATLRRWRDGDYGQGRSPERIEAKADAIGAKLTERFGDIAVASLDAAKGKIGEASYRDLLIGAGIATEKHQLLTGGATHRTEQVKIALIDASALRTLAAQVVKIPPALPDIVEGQYKEQPEAVSSDTNSAPD